MTGWRAAWLPYRVKVCRRGCLGSRTGGSVVLWGISNLDFAQLGENIPPKRIQQIPNHRSWLLRGFASQDNGSSPYCEGFAKSARISLRLSGAGFGDLVGGLFL